MISYSQEKSFMDSLNLHSLASDAVDWVADNLEPDEVYDDNALQEWAENNGYIKES